LARGSFRAVAAWDRGSEGVVRRYLRSEVVEPEAADFDPAKYQCVGAHKRQQKPAIQAVGDSAG